MLEQLLALYVLHDEVNVSDIVVGLVVLHDVRVVELVQDLNLVHYHLHVVLKFAFVKNFDRHVEIWVVQVLRQEDLAECAFPQQD